MPDAPVHTGDRRPIKSRDWRISQAAAHWLADRNVSPNAISVAGMLCCLAAGAALVGTALFPELARLFWLAAAGLVVLRLTANMLDGMVAIASGKTSAVGELYNEVPDRVSDAATLIGAGYAVGGDPVLGFWAACAALFTAYVRTIGKVAGAPQEFCGPMAKQQRMAVIIIVALYAGLTPAAWQPLWGGEHRLGLCALGLVVILAGSVITSIRRLMRIVRVLRKQRP